MPKVRINLYELMAKRNIRTIGEVAEKAGLSTKTISAIFNNKTQRIDFDTISKLCHVLGCEIDELLIFEKEVAR